MSRVDDGGPAFAAVTRISSKQMQMEKTDGMSLRDYLAAHCPASTVKHIARVSIRPSMASKPADDVQAVAAHESELRYRYADAMIAEKRRTELGDG